VETGDEVLIDLGYQPLANRLVMEWEQSLEPRYPLAPVICQNALCRLIQLPELPDGVGFGKDYPYRSGQSLTWERHIHQLIKDLRVTAGDELWDIGGNDGCMERHMPEGAKYVNLDPSGVGEAPNYRAFLTERLGWMFKGQCDFVLALNVAAHVPDLDDFFAGAHHLLRPTGVLVVEVQDVNQLIEQGAWDCIYAEHYSYFNAQTLCDAIERRGFFVEKIEPQPTHGGSVRVTARPHNSGTKPLRLPKPYPKWPITDPLMRQMILLNEWMGHRRVVGYGAPAKASTFLNRYSLGTRELEYIVDSTPEKIGKFTPGSHIPIHGPDVLLDEFGPMGVPPDIVVILAWNWWQEILPKIPEGPEVWCRGERLR
jgi:SAM-dependent methyltransferase